MARLIARFLKPGFNHLAFALLFSASSRAAELGPATNATPAFPLAGLTLADAKHLAFLRNWDLLAAKSDVDLATAQRLVVREFPNPTASFSTAKVNVDSIASSTTLVTALCDCNSASIRLPTSVGEWGPAGTGIHVD